MKKDYTIKRLFVRKSRPSASSTAAILVSLLLHTDICTTCENSVGAIRDNLMSSPSFAYLLCLYYVVHGFENAAALKQKGGQLGNFHVGRAPEKKGNRRTEENPNSTLVPIVTLAFYL
jgi:hypothetical protein